MGVNERKSGCVRFRRARALNRQKVLNGGAGFACANPRDGRFDRSISQVNGRARQCRLGRSRGKRSLRQGTYIHNRRVRLTGTDYSVNRSNRASCTTAKKRKARNDGIKSIRLSKGCAFLSFFFSLRPSSLDGQSDVTPHCLTPLWWYIVGSIG